VQQPLAYIHFGFRPLGQDQHALADQDEPDSLVQDGLGDRGGGRVVSQQPHTGTGATFVFVIMERCGWRSIMSCVRSGIMASRLAPSRR